MRSLTLDPPAHARPTTGGPQPSEAAHDEMRDLVLRARAG